MADYAEVLADLKKEFNGKILLSPADIAPYFAQSAAAQWAMRERGNFPVKYSKVGRLVVIKIYDLARYIADDQSEQDTPTPTPAPQKTAKRQVSGVPNNTRRIPNFAKSLMMFGQQVEQEEMKAAFMRSLFSELEQIELLRDKDKLPKQPRIGL